MTSHAVVHRGGEVLVLTPEARSVLHRLLRDAVRVYTYAPPVVRELIAALERGEELSRAAAAYNGMPPDDDPAELTSDLITTTEAGVLLNLKPRAVRARCERGSFASARRIDGGPWRIARAEVLERAVTRSVA